MPVTVTRAHSVLALRTLQNVYVGGWCFGAHGAPVFSACLLLFLTIEKFPRAFALDNCKEIGIIKHYIYYCEEIQLCGLN